MIIGQSFISQIEKLVANTNSLTTVTDSIDLNGVVNGAITFFSVADTGTHANHVITLQYSPDNSNWIDGSKTLLGIGCVEVPVTAARYVRLKVTTVEGGLSTTDIYLLAR